jgi:PAS domain S-box-containing protein
MAGEIRVLYVDDEPGLLEIARLFLERTGGFSVTTSESVQEALGCLSAWSHDIIVSDYQMPEMDGIAFLKEVRQRSPDIPFILFTGRGREEVVIDAINNGADFYIQKGGAPAAQFAELSHKIRQAVRRREVERDLQLIFRNMINAFVVFESVFDENGRYASFRFGQFNDAYSRIARVQPEDVRGKDVFEVWPATEQSWVEVYGAVATTGVPRVFDMYHEPTKGWYHCNAYRPTDSPARICVIFEDITDRRRDEEKLHAAYEQVTAAEEELRKQYDELSATEQRIRESEEKYRLVVENSQDAIYLHRSDRLVFVNRRASDLTGYPHDELMKIRLWDLVHPDDRDELIGRAKRRFSGADVPPGFTARLLARDGTVRFCEFNVDLVMYQGAPAVLGIARDITERRQVEEALQKSEEKYRELVENANSIILKMDKAGTIIFFNEYAQRFFGYTNDEIIGKPVVGTIVPATESGSGRDLRILLDTIVHDPGPYLFNENENITRDGKRVWIQWQNRPLTGTDGGLAGVLCVGIDMTRRKQAEDALRESEEKYRRIIENMQDAYIRADENGIIIMASPSAARIFGYGSPEEMAGLPTISLYSDPAQRAEVVRTLHDGGEIADLTREGQKKDGTTFWFSLNVQFIRDGQGRIRGFEGTMRDISERRSMEHALRETNRKLTMLSGITRHDIKNQLMVLDGMAELLRTRMPDPSLEPCFARISAASSRIANLIQFTGEYQEIGVHAPRWQDVRALVDDAARDIAPDQVVLENDLPEGMEIFADPLVARVVCNLVDNAVRHGGKIRTLRFSYQELNGDRIIVCSDDGDGVAIQEKEKIFDLGYGKHTGFGLAISREILAITGITIRETGTPGEGARFAITVPGGQVRVRQ